MEKEKEEKDLKEQLKEINKHVRDALNQWANIALELESRQAAFYMNYYPIDLINTTYLFQHVASNIGIKAGKIDTETAQIFGNRLRSLIVDMTGYDPKGVMLESQDETLYRLESQRELLLNLMDQYGGTATLDSVRHDLVERIEKRKVPVE
jgi:hypothetical protein